MRGSKKLGFEIKLTRFDGNEKFTGTIVKDCLHFTEATARGTKPGERPVYERVGNEIIARCSVCGKIWGKLKKEE
jgi:hypothetical protein